MDTNEQRALDHLKVRLVKQKGIFDVRKRTVRAFRLLLKYSHQEFLCLCCLGVRSFAGYFLPLKQRSVCANPWIRTTAYTRNSYTSSSSKADLPCKYTEWHVHTNCRYTFCFHMCPERAVLTLKCLIHIFLTEAFLCAYAVGNVCHMPIIGSR